MSFVGVYFIVAGHEAPATVIKATQPPPDEPPVSIASKIFPGKSCRIISYTLTLFFYIVT